MLKCFWNRFKRIGGGHLEMRPLQTQAVAQWLLRLLLNTIDVNLLVKIIAISVPESMIFLLHLNKPCTVWDRFSASDYNYEDTHVPIQVPQHKTLRGIWGTTSFIGAEQHQQNKDIEIVPSCVMLIYNIIYGKGLFIEKLPDTKWSIVSSDWSWV